MDRYQWGNSNQKLINVIHNVTIHNVTTHNVTHTDSNVNNEAYNDLMGDKSKMMMLPTNTKRHLIVDDSNYNREILEQYLALINIQTDQASNGMKAINMCSVLSVTEDGKHKEEKDEKDEKYEKYEKHEKYEKYDIIWMDIKMPIMDGIEATKRIRELGFKGAIIGVTGAVEMSSMLKYKSAGITMILSKPIDRNNLFDLVKGFYRN